MVNLRGLARYYISNGYKKTIENYNDIIDEGWEFLCNINRKLDVREIRKILRIPYEEEIFLGTKAFDNKGYIESGRALFVRRIPILTFKLHSKISFPQPLDSSLSL